MVTGVGWQDARLRWADVWVRGTAATRRPLLAALGGARVGESESASSDQGKTTRVSTSQT